MGSVERQWSAVSDTGRSCGMTEEDKKRKRMMSNRESARRSRMRKQKQLEDLTNKVNHLQDKNKRLVEIILDVEQRYVEIQSQNRVLRAQALELSDRLESINSVLRSMQNIHLLNMVPSDEPITLLDPSQMRCSSVPIITSAQYRC